MATVDVKASKVFDAASSVVHAVFETHLQIGLLRDHSFVWSIISGELRRLTTEDDQCQYGRHI